MLYGIGVFFVRIIRLFTIAWVCVLLLNMDQFSWIFFLKIFFSLSDFMTWILLHLLVICWLDMTSVTCCTVVGCFILIFIIHTLVKFIAVNVWFHGIFFLDGIHITCCDVRSISQRYQWDYPLMKILLLPKICHIWWVGGLRDQFYRFEGINICDINKWRTRWPFLPNLLLFSSNLADEKYLSLLVCVTHHFIVDLVLTHEWSLLCPFIYF